MNDFQSRAWKLIENMTDEMDIVLGATVLPWRLRINPDDLRVLREFDAGTKPDWDNRDYFFEKDGHEYFRPVENNNIPFILDYRIVCMEGAGLVVELDDEIDPDVHS